MSDEMPTDIHVDRRENHSREISIYDRFGGAGNISLTVQEAAFVHERLESVLDG